MNTANLKHSTFKNILYSLAGFGWPVIMAILITPIIVRHFGVKEYGIYIFISTLISLAGILDLGVSTAISKFISERHGGSDTEGLKKLFKTANTILICIGIVGAILIISSIFIGIKSFPSEITSSYEIYIPSFICAGIIFFINSINSIHIIIPTAYQRFDIGSKIGIVFITIQQLGILAIALLNGPINAIFLLQVLLALIFYFIYRKYAVEIVHKENRLFIDSYGWDKQEAAKCYKFGTTLFLNNLAGSSLTYLDRMIIPLFLGPSSLTYYSLPGSLTNKIPTLSGTLSSVVFPMTAYFEGGGNRNMTKNLYERSMRLIAVISTAITVTFIAFAYPILLYWINRDLADKATGVLIILALTNLVIAITSPLNSFLLGMGKLKALTITSIFTAGTNALLLILLLPHFGIMGAAWSYLLAFIPYAFLIYATEKHYLELTFRRIYYVKLIARLFLTSTLIFMFDMFLIKPLITNFFLVIIAIILSCVIFIITHYLLGFFDKEDTHDILTFTKQIMSILG